MRGSGRSLLTLNEINVAWFLNISFRAKLSPPEPLRPRGILNTSIASTHHLGVGALVSLPQKIRNQKRIT